MIRTKEQLINLTEKLNPIKIQIAIVGKFIENENYFAGFDLAWSRIVESNKTHIVIFNCEEGPFIEIIKPIRDHRFRNIQLSIK